MRESGLDKIFPPAPVRPVPKTTKTLDLYTVFMSRTGKKEQKWKDFLEKTPPYAIISMSAFMQFPHKRGVFGFICVCPEYLSKNEEWSSFEYPVQQKGI